MRKTAILIAAATLALAACHTTSTQPAPGPAPAPTATPARDAYGCPIGNAAAQEKCDQIKQAQGVEPPIAD